MWYGIILNKPFSFGFWLICCLYASIMSPLRDDINPKNNHCVTLEVRLKSVSVAQAQVNVVGCLSWP